MHHHPHQGNQHIQHHQTNHHMHHSHLHHMQQQHQQQQHHHHHHSQTHPHQHSHLQQHQHPNSSHQHSQQLHHNQVPQVQHHQAQVLHNAHMPIPSPQQQPWPVQTHINQQGQSNQPVVSHHRQQHQHHPPQQTPQQQHVQQNQAVQPSSQSQPTQQPQHQASQQQIQPQPQPQPQQQQQPTSHHHSHHHHATRAPAPPIMIGQQHSNPLYTQIGSSFVPQNMPPQYNRHPHPPPLPPTSLHSDPIPMSNQPQQHVSISNQHPNTMPYHPMHQVINTTTAGVNNVHQINPGPLMDHHITNRPYVMGPFGHPMSFIPTQIYPSHMAPMANQLRIDEMGIRPPFEQYNSMSTTVPVTAPMTQIPASKPHMMPGRPQANLTAATPTTNVKTRARQPLKIVDPHTKHAFTYEELTNSNKVEPSQDPTASSAEPQQSRISTTDLSPTSGKGSLNDDVASKSSDDMTKTSTVATTLATSVSSSSSPTTTASVGTGIDRLSPATISPTTTSSHSQSEDTKLVKEALPSPVLTTSSSSTKLDLNKAETNVTSGLESSLEMKESHGTNQNSESKPCDEIDASSGSTNVEPKLPDIVSDDVIQNGGNDLNKLDVVSELASDVASLSVSDTPASPTDPKTQSEADKNSAKQIQPNLPYAPGQFTPLNPGGSRRYSPEFLKAVGELIEKKTTGLNYDFTPHYFKPIPACFPPPPRRASQQTAKPRKIIDTHSLKQEVELKTAEKPWKPEIDKPKVEPAEMDTKRLLKTFRGHLNKLTPQKYESLIEKIGALDLNGSERLNSVIDLVFDKAVDEPGFCELYAKMCKVIADKDPQFNFHLVKKCQEEFETTDLYDGLNVDERKSIIEKEPDAAKKKLLSEELYEDQRLRRKKYLGTIKLIGEMYKFGLLLPKIIGLCMAHLLGNTSNENIECLCSLITTVGFQMSNESDTLIRTSLQNTLNVLKEIATTKKGQEVALESRVKFKILDTIDLSKSEWKPGMVGENRKGPRDSSRQQYQNHSNLGKSSVKTDERSLNRRGSPYNSINRRS